MEYEGKVWKSGDFWLVDVPCLDVMTQGKSREHALKMIKDAIETLVEGYFPAEDIDDLDINIHDYSGKAIGVTSANNNLMVALLLIRQREISNSTVRDVTERLGSKSPNAYSQYERGEVNVTLNKFEKLLFAVNPDTPLRLKMG